MFSKIIKLIIFLTLAPLTLTGSDPVIVQDEEQPPEFDRLWNYSDPAATETAFQGIYEEYKGSATSSYKAQLLSQLARAKGLQGKFDEGFTFIEEAKRIMDPNDKLAAVRVLLEQGRLFNSSGVADIAKPLFMEAKALAEDGGFDFYAIDAVHMLGIVEPPEKQIEWNLLAIDMIEKSEDNRAKNWLGPLLNNTGWSYFDMSEYSKALALFQKGVVWREDIGDDVGTIIAKWTVARTYRALEKYDEALDILLELEKEINDKGLNKDGYIYEEMGELYLIKEDSDLYRKYFGLAFSILSEDSWLQKNEPERLARLEELSK